MNASTSPGLIAVCAMARPRRPLAEKAAVLAAAGEDGSATQRAARLADRVARAALAFVDADPADRLLAILQRGSLTPIDTLATDAEIDTAALIVAERLRRLEARGGQHLPERQWSSEDRATIAAVADMLAERYRRILRSRAK